MPRFTVTWSIDVDADTHEEAARKAQAAQSTPDATATVYEVEMWGPDEYAQVIDLSALDNPEHIPWDASKGNPSV